MKENELLLLRLVELMFEKEQTFLLIDELYEDEIIGTYIRNIQIDSPYQQLLFEGVISQFLQGEELVVNITVENYFHHLLGLILQKDDRYQSSESLIQLVQSNNLKGVKEGVSNLLGFDVELGNFNRITQLIDLSEGDEDILEICVLPLVNSLMIHGVEKLAKVLLEKPTMNDWLVMLEIDSKLNELESHILRKDFLEEVIPHNQFQTKEEVLLGLRSIALFDKDEALMYFSKIDKNSDFIQDDMYLSLQLGICEKNFGNYDKALDLFEKRLLIHIKNYGEEDPIVANIISWIGNIWYAKRNYDKSLEYYEKSIAIYLNTIGENNLDVNWNNFIWGTYNGIGLVWKSKGDYNKALEYYEKCLVNGLKTIGENHSNIAAVYKNIASVWKLKGSFEKSLEYYDKSLKIQLKINSEINSSVADIYTEIGSMWESKGNYDKSLEYYEKSIAIYLKTTGENHSPVALTYHNMGSVWKSKSDFDKSLNYYDKSLNINLKIIGENNSSVATTYFYIGSVWKSKKNYDKSTEFYEKSLLIYLNIFGENHSSVAITYDHLGSLCKINGDFDKSLEYYEKSLVIKLKTIGENHASVATSYNNIGLVWKSKGNYDKALEYYEKGLVIKLKTKGDNHSSVATSYFDIGKIAKELGKYKVAIENFKKGYKIQNVGGYPFQIAKCYEFLMDNESALYYYIQSAEIRKEDPDLGIKADSTQESISNAIRLAKELDKEHELPEWIKNTN